MAKICLASTLTAIIPSSISLLFKPKKRQFLYAIANSSLAFFLFSFQVHEKSILIAAVPIALLFPFEAFISMWFLQVATFSMLPLLVKDGLTCAYIGTAGAFYLLIKIIIDASKDVKHKNLNFLQILMNSNSKKKKNNYDAYIIKLYQLSLAVQILLILAFFFVEPPSSLPFLHSLLNSAYSCCHFVFFFLYLNVKQVFYE
jgi:alpha-1,3-glucosyltransferase